MIETMQEYENALVIREHIDEVTALGYKVYFPETRKRIEADITEFARRRLEELGYETSAVRVLPDGRIVWIQPFAYTSAIMCMRPGQDLFEDRWCFHSTTAALTALWAWSTALEPEPTGWHRHLPSGRRRPDGDPGKEYVNL